MKRSQKVYVDLDVDGVRIVRASKDSLQHLLADWSEDKHVAATFINLRNFVVCYSIKTNTLLSLKTEDEIMLEDAELDDENIQQIIDTNMVVNEEVSNPQIFVAATNEVVEVVNEVVEVVNKEEN